MVTNLTTQFTMKSNSCHHDIIFVFVLFMLLFSHVSSMKGFNDFTQENENSTMKSIKALLKKVNKPFVKSIKSPDGDIIDCVLTHLQPAFDLPELKGKLQSDPPKIPIEHETAAMESKVRQLWNLNGESCPDETIPIRRTKESEILRSININSISRFGKKPRTKPNPSNGPFDNRHELRIGYVNKAQYLGAKATFNVWQPNVQYDEEYSRSQMWVESEVNHPANTVEVGWTVEPLVFSDRYSRLFIYWTPDGYNTGCMNLLCPGFVQTSNKVTLGGVLSPVSTYAGQQIQFTASIWKDGNTGNWWLKLGSETVGYWPASLFQDLNKASVVIYGGEVFGENVVNHTATHMGSGHFPGEGYQRAAYISDFGVVDLDNNMNRLSVSDLTIRNGNTGCYDIKTGVDALLGDHIYYGGAGNNIRCP